MMSLLDRGKRRLLLGLVLSAAGIWAGRQFLPAYYIAQARDALERRQPESALASLHFARRIDANRAETHFLLARTHRRLGRLDLVRIHLKRAWELDFPIERLRREEWLALAQAGQMAKAEPRLRQLLLDPGDDGAEICEAFVNGYFATYRFGRAFGLLEAWQADYPDDSQPYLFRATFAEHRGDESGAVDAYRKALSLAPHRRDIQARLALGLVKLHQYEEAAELFRQLLDDDPEAPELLAGWGECLMEQGKPETARRVLMQLLHKQPDHDRGRLVLGKLEVDAGRLTEALRLFRAVAKDRPYDSQARYLLALSLQQAGEAESAKEHFAFVADARQNLARARELTDQAIKTPDDVKLHYEIGTILLKYDAPAEGAAWLHSVLELQPDHHPTHEILARYYAEQGNEGEAGRHRRLASQKGVGTLIESEIRSTESETNPKHE